MFNNYYDVRNWLESFIPLVYGKEELGLVRIENLLGKLGNPQRKFKSIHVAGTSGKGSTCWYIAKLLKVSKVKESLFSTSGKAKVSRVSKGLKIGLHVSPHLVDIRERMQIFQCQMSNVKCQMSNGGLMPMGRFLRLFNEIRPVVEKIQREKPELTPSYFEILVAASFKYFAEEKVDWAVVEVGLGGRLDATNVLVPEVSVITNIGLDHTEILGKTVEKIAYEKAGIIKKGVPVVTTAGGRALEVIADVAKKQQAPLITIDTQDGLLSNKLLAIEAVNLALGISHLSFPSSIMVEGKLQRESRDWILDPFGSTQGKQVENDKKGMPGRLEKIVPGVILDGAHNPQKIEFLINFLRKFTVVGSQFTVVVAFKKGKNWKKMVDLLVKNLPIKQVIATKFHAVTDMGPPRLASGEAGRFAAVEPEEIRDYVVNVHRSSCIVHRNSQGAVFEALTSNSYKTNQLILVTGSLYLVGEVRTMWYLPEF